MEAENKTKLSDCVACKAKCCRHVALEIDKPTCKRDYDNIRWYLMHKDVVVFVDKDGDWNLEFLTKCENLRENNTCKRYNHRPVICREYPAVDDDCEFLGDDDPYKLFFSSVKEFEKYLDKRRVDWRWKREKK